MLDLISRNDLAGPPIPEKDVSVVLRPSGTQVPLNSTLAKTVCRSDFFPKDDNLGVLKSTATTCACVRGRVGVSECGGEVGVGSLGGSRPARNFHFRRNCTSILYLDPIPRSYTSILYLDPIPRSCSNFSAENLILSTQRIVDWLSTKPPGGRSCRKRQFYNSKMHRAL